MLSEGQFPQLTTVIVAEVVTVVNDKFDTF